MWVFFIKVKKFRKSPKNNDIIFIIYLFCVARPVFIVSYDIGFKKKDYLGIMKGLSSLILFELQ